MLQGPGLMCNPTGFGFVTASRVDSEDPALPDRLDVPPQQTLVHVKAVVQKPGGGVSMSKVQWQPLDPPRMRVSIELLPSLGAQDARGGSKKNGRPVDMNYGPGFYCTDVHPSTPAKDIMECCWNGAAFRKKADGTEDAEPKKVYKQGEFQPARTGKFKSDMIEAVIELDREEILKMGYQIKTPDHHGGHGQGRRTYVIHHPKWDADEQRISQGESLVERGEDGDIRRGTVNPHRLVIPAGHPAARAGLRFNWHDYNGEERIQGDAVTGEGERADKERLLQWEKTDDTTGNPVTHKAKAYISRSEPGSLPRKLYHYTSLETLLVICRDTQLTPPASTPLPPGCTSRRTVTTMSKSWNDSICSGAFDLHWARGLVQALVDFGQEKRNAVLQGTARPGEFLRHIEDPMVLARCGFAHCHPMWTHPKPKHPSPFADLDFVDWDHAANEEVFKDQCMVRLAMVLWRVSGDQGLAPVKDVDRRNYIEMQRRLDHIGSFIFSCGYWEKEKPRLWNGIAPGSGHSLSGAMDTLRYVPAVRNDSATAAKKRFGRSRVGHLQSRAQFYSRR